MDTVIIDAGTLEFSAEDLTATGMLIPFGVECRSNLGMFTYAPGVLELPTDLTGMALNLEHKREDVVGGFSRVWETPQGVMATFKYRDTPAGRAAFQEGKDGKRKHLSAEVANVRIRDRQALPGGSLFAAAQVERPAFAGATLLAAEDTPAEGAPSETQSRYVTEYTDADGNTWRRVEETKAETVETDAGTETTVTTTVTETTDATPAEDTQEEGGGTLTATATTPGQQTPGITIPATLLASMPGGMPTTGDEVDLGTVFASMAMIKNGSGSQVADAETLLAALADITTSGDLAGGVRPKAWVGKLWQGKSYVRKYIDLVTHIYGPIDIAGRGGFKIDQATARGLVKKRTGEKVELPTGSAGTSGASSTRESYGYAADVAREWFDLEGGAEVQAAFWAAIAEGYAQVTDEDALKTLFQVGSKTTAALDRLIAPMSLPTGTPANSQYYPAVVQLIQAIEAVSDANDDPSWAVVNPVAWSQLIFTPKDLLPEFITLDVSVGEGTATVDGKVHVRKAPQSFFPGTKSTDPQTLAGAKAAVEFKELGETPIQIDALDVARYGLDRAVVGYLETLIVRPESVVLIGTKP